MKKHSMITAALVLATVAGPVAAAPAFPFAAHDGHRVDGDKEDEYGEVTVHADGSWHAMVHTSPTGHWLGGCGRTSMVFYDANGTWLLVKDVGVFCTGTRDGLGGPSDRIDNIDGPPGDISPDVLSRTARFAVVVSGGQKDTSIPWDQVISLGLQIATAIASSS